MKGDKIIKPGLAVVISSPSGTGKTTICHQLIEHYDDYQYSISATTRPPRNTEKNGRDYIFLSEKEFLEAKDHDDFIETAKYIDNWYGTPRKPLEQAIGAGRIVLLDIDVQGGESIRKALPDAVTIFLIPPSFTELERRLTNRKTENKEAITKRLIKAREELRAWNDYEYIVVNDELGRAVDEVNCIIRSEQKKTKRLRDKKYWQKTLGELLGLS
jgi:guanylate kinase